MKFTASILTAGLVSAFPVMNNDPVLLKKAASILSRQSLPKDPLGFSKSETNCGPVPCLTFDSSQLVPTSGEHAYAAPGEGDIRGPCPGLNAAANHGYLPRSGIASITETITGLGALYGMSVDLAAFLAAYAVAIDGNIAQTVWSIGGPLPADPLTSITGGTGQGISYSHNNYEGDASVCRGDAYINNGDAHSLILSKFEALYAVGGPEDRHTIDKYRQRFAQVQDDSIATNPEYFTAVFSTFLVVPAAYNFIINFMSNHTAEEPSGYLDGSTLKQFFGISGEPGSFVWNKGQERVPDNWYRRPLDNEYNIPGVLLDLGIGYVSYPESIKFGGNLGKTNTFTGVNVENFTSGAFNAENLFEGDNFACFSTQLIQQAVPDIVNPAVNAVGTAVSMVRDALKPYLDTLDCPQVGKYDFTLLEPFPGYKYSPTGPATNY